MKINKNITSEGLVVRKTVEKSENNSLLPIVAHCLEFSVVNGEY